MSQNKNSLPPADSERFANVGRGVTLCYEAFGDPAESPILLIQGLGTQMIGWPDELVERLVDAGHHVVRFDNRDNGRSTRVGIRPPRVWQLGVRRFDADQYTLTDMARDTAGLIDALELEPVHAVGVSMGGMIAQTLAAQYPERVRSLTSIMSTTGARGKGRPAPSTMRKLITPPARDEDEMVERFVEMFRHIGSAGFPFDEAYVRELARRSFQRGFHPAGTGRQLGAILKSGDRTREVGTITAPTLVLHGDSDPMVDPSGGAATAAAIPGARLQTIVGMGHDLPAGALDQLAGLVLEHAARAERSVSAAA
jgi:pimeloyl-ACP methyl ester carboxylesterase